MAQGKKIKYVFCYDNFLGIIENREFQPIEVDKIKFMRIIVQLIANSKCVAADVILKEAIKEYTEVNEFAKLYKGRNLSDSKFYMRWRERIKKHKKFEIVALQILEARQEKAQIIKKAREHYILQKSVYEESIKRSFKKVGKKLAER